ncbi:MAG: hypothetical protein NTU62_18720 [Spirochaetes bacterium]|nr:hypothetical protein [Spirochaetota bacterium]
MSAASAARRTGRRFYTVAILAYLSVVVALVVLALFGRGARERLGDARVTVHYAALPLFGRVVDRAAVSYQGLRLSLNGSTPIEFPSGGDPARLREMRSHGEGIDIGFERDLRLELRRSDDESWSLAFAGAEGESLSLSVPLRVPGGLAPLGDVPLISWRRAGHSYYLSLPRGSRVDAAAGSLVLSLGPGSRELRFGPAAGEGEDLSARWLSDQAALVDQDGFAASRDAFLAEAWRGWTKARRSSDGTLWQDADGRYVFNEEVGPALLAEAIERNEYPAQRTLVAAALDRQLRNAPNSVQSAAASVFVGSLREHVRRVRAAEASGIERIRTLLAEGDPALFLFPGLIPFVLDHGPFNLVQEIVTLAGTLRAGSLEPAAALGVLETYLDYDQYAAAGGTMAARAREVVQKRLVPSIRKTDEGLFLETTAGSVDTVSSLRCGSLLVRAGSTLGDAQFAAIGRTLIASAVALGRANGFLPGTLELSGSTASPPDDTPGAIAPESVYRFVAADRHVPREIPLHLGVGPGAWLWTAADLVSAEASPTGLSLTIAFPAGQPHYLVVDGVRSIARLELHGTAWRPAADYAQYADGWAYDAAEQLLFVKLTGRADTEEIAVQY